RPYREAQREGQRGVVLGQREGEEGEFQRYYQQPSLLHEPWQRDRRDRGTAADGSTTACSRAPACPAFGPRNDAGARGSPNASAEAGFQGGSADLHTGDRERAPGRPARRGSRALAGGGASSRPVGAAR